MLKKIVWLVMLTGVIACSPEPATEKVVSKPVVVQLAKVKAVPDQNHYTFPATVSAVKTIELSFEVSGRLNQLDLVQGKKVKKGYLLASIDRAPFERRVEEQQVRLDIAQKDLNRIKTMFDKGLASQSMFDSAQTQMELAQIDLNNALQDLSYTELRAPFDAQVSERLVDNNSYVQSGKPIARLQDLSRIYFTFNVPERILSANASNELISATATLLSPNSPSFAIEYVEHRTQPDPITQTYQVVFAMEPVDKQIFTPGARARVALRLQNKQPLQGLVVPLNALVGDKDKGFFVWRFRDSQQSVEKVAVEVLKIIGNRVIIDSSLTQADHVVRAGVNKLGENQQVIPYKAP
ncbi:efflux RND transporter periplasmic adaptor subunit [Thalassotalea mangrovi]|uniref:Efflux RND transporter periplasmic adaptor subunit n=1 Tax=Thalassotalea mangrovi TaxID=2572245 RepID=A0A4U1B7R8_9GAMM|nr:efflux RND transporter periplasmic adaptor subunit [Thalassotalea mangrovi]TKB46654.1 efflux RND transporter periplasmic adaptor subunit [Thalassotalea mangrovi]